MTEPSGEPSPSLIQQRMTLERWKNFPIIMMIIFGANGAWWLYRAISEGEFAYWLLAAACVVVLAMSGVALVSTIRKLRAFEAEHGPEAGKRE